MNNAHDTTITYFGTDGETYVAVAGRLFCVQSPDLVGVADYREVAELPGAAVELSSALCSDIDLTSLLSDLRQ